MATRTTPPAAASPAEAPGLKNSDPVSAVPWLSVVAEKVSSMRYGVVQIVVHDSKVVQIERTERTRFDVTNASRGA